MLFAGHETFHVRDGWLHKGIVAISNNPFTFADPNATDDLGVGRNMVNAIRYWLVASGMAVEARETVDGRAKVKLIATSLGELVFKQDRYLEEELTLWTLHREMACNFNRATAWFWLFNRCPLTRLDSQTFINYLSRWIMQEQPKKPIALASLQKDFNCIVRTYSPGNLRNRKLTPEDTFESPFASLRLMEYLENSETLRLNVGSRRIDPSAFAYATLQFVRSLNRETKEVGLNELQSAPFSPGRVFLLGADSLIEAISGIAELFGKKSFAFSRTGGLNTLRVGDVEPFEVLADAYSRIGARR